LHINLNLRTSVSLLQEEIIQIHISFIARASDRALCPSDVIRGAPIGPL